MKIHHDVVFNEKALVYSGLILIGILIFHAVYMAIVNRSYRYAFQHTTDKGRYMLAQALFIPGAFTLSLAHIVEILGIGYTIHWMGLVSDIQMAIVFAGSCYTTIGYGQDILPTSWDLVTVTMALSGLISVAWTSSVLFGMAASSQTAYDMEQKHKRGKKTT